MSHSVAPMIKAECRDASGAIDLVEPFNAEIDYVKGKSPPLKILVVDDDSFVRDMLTNILLSAQYAVLTAGDGLDALKQLTPESGIGLIISDMNMPGMSGLELLRTVREANKNIPVIILTGNQEIKVAIEAMKNGANDYILKDENIEHTVAVSVENVMEVHRLRTENQRLLVDLKRKNLELEILSLLDGLTGVANRRFFDNRSQQEWSRASREQKPISVVMIDIDYFKPYNDSYGHQQGDICLQLVASALSAALKRPSDFIARYGGEEFVAVLPGTEIEGAKQLAEAMRENVLKLAIAHKTSTVHPHVTISLGVASRVPKRFSSYSDLIRKADEALYAAKHAGKNRTEIAPA